MQNFLRLKKQIFLVACVVASVVLSVVLWGYTAENTIPVSAQTPKCSDDGAAGSVNVTVNTITPVEKTISIPATETEFDPPILVKKGPVGGCCHLVWIFELNGNEVHRYTQAFESGDFTGRSGGGILTDKITSNDAFLNGSFEIVDYSGSTSDTTPVTFSVSDNDQVQDMGTLASITGVNAVSNPGPLDERHTVSIAVSGDAKAGLGSSASAVDSNKTETDDLNETLFVCKNAFGSAGNAGVCDFQECDNVADPLCSDGLDNDNDGLTDFPSDKGCTAPDDGDETNPGCIDGVDNDNDGRTDFPEDPGCDNEQDGDETSPLCSDGLDNDGDGVIDFENGDRGCDSARDNDETNPPIDRNISFQRISKPTLVIQPTLERDERLIFEDPPPGCPTCELTTTPDHTQFIGGDPSTPDNFIVTAEYRDTADDSLFYIIVAVGDYTEHDELFTTDGRAYTGLGGLEISSQ